MCQKVHLASPLENAGVGDVGIGRFLTVSAHRSLRSQVKISWGGGNDRISAFVYDFGGNYYRQPRRNLWGATGSLTKMFEIPGCLIRETHGLEKVQENHVSLLMKIMLPALQLMPSTFPTSVKPAGSFIRLWQMSAWTGSFLWHCGRGGRAGPWVPLPALQNNFLFNARQTETQGSKL